MTFPEKTPYPLKISQNQDFSLVCKNCNNCTTQCTTACTSNETCTTSCNTGCANSCQGCTTGEYQVYGIRAQYGGGSVIDTNTVNGTTLARKYPVYNTTYCNVTVAIETFSWLPSRIGSTWLKNKHSLNGYWITDADNVCERCNNNCFDACDGGCYGRCVRCASCYDGPAFS